MTATPTYSQSITGYPVGALFGGATPINGTLVPDVTVDNINLVTAAGQGVCLQTGSPMLAKGPDGALHWYRLRPPGYGGGTTTHPVLEYIGP